MTVAKKKSKPAKKKAAKKKAAVKKKKKIAIPPNLADLQSVRAAIDRVVAHINAGRPKKLAAADVTAQDKADQLLKALGDARAMVASECCQSDQNCAF